MIYISPFRNLFPICESILSQMLKARASAFYKNILIYGRLNTLRANNSLYDRNIRKCVHRLQKISMFLNVNVLQMYIQSWKASYLNHTQKESSFDLLAWRKK